MQNNNKESLLKIFESEHAKSFYRLALAIEYASYKIKKNKNLQANIEIELKLNKQIKDSWQTLSECFGENSVCLDVNHLTSNYSDKEQE